MNRDQLAARHRTALSRYWRVSIDRGGPVPELLGELAAIAEEYAAGHAEPVTARQEPATSLTDDYGHPVREDGTVIPETPEAAEHREARARGEGPSARTRTRTRGGPK